MYAGTPFLVLVAFGFVSALATEFGLVSNQTSSILSSALFVLFPVSIAAVLLLAGEFEYQGGKHSIRISKEEKPRVYWSAVIGLFALGVLLFLWITATS